MIWVVSGIAVCLFFLCIKCLHMASEWRSKYETEQCIMEIRACEINQLKRKNAELSQTLDDTRGLLVNERRFSQNMITELDRLHGQVEAWPDVVVQGCSVDDAQIEIRRGER